MNCGLGSNAAFVYACSSVFSVYSQCVLKVTKKEVSPIHKSINTMNVSTTSEDSPSFFQSSCTGTTEALRDGNETKGQIEATATGVIDQGQDNHTVAVRGGFTCCVPYCFNNSKKNKSLSFYRIPKEKNLRRIWLHKISRENFKPTDGHRVCSSHFLDGKKTYMNNVPLIVPKTIKPVPAKPRLTMTSSGQRPRMGVLCEEVTRNNQECASEILDDAYKESENPEYDEKQCLIQQYETELERLRQKINDMEVQHRKEIDDLQQEIIYLRKENFERSFTIENAMHKKGMLKFYTGLPDAETFEIVFGYLGPAVNNLVYVGSSTAGGKIDSEGYTKCGPKRTFSPKQELFIVLARLRCALLEQDLAFRLGISVAHVSRICTTWIDFLHSRLRSLPIWAPRQAIDMTMPKCFKESYPSTRVIIDCSEIFIEKPSSLRSQSVTYSSYKHHNTAKGLIGIAPSSAITFVSDLFSGRVSDKKATKECGIYDLLQTGDSVMADRGFDIDDDLPPGVSLNIPAFMNGKEQLNLNEETETRRIAAVRIHVERAIARVKSFRILKTTLPLSMAAEINKIWVICCYLTNFQPPVLVEKENKEQ